MVDMTVINAWLLYRRLSAVRHGSTQSKPVSLHDFKTRVTHMGTNDVVIMRKATARKRKESRLCQHLLLNFAMMGFITTQNIRMRECGARKDHVLARLE